LSTKTSIYADTATPAIPEPTDIPIPFELLPNQSVSIIQGLGEAGALVHATFTRQDAAAPYTFARTVVDPEYSWMITVPQEVQDAMVAGAKYLVTLRYHAGGKREKLSVSMEDLAELAD